MAWSDGPEGVGDVEAEVGVVVAHLRGSAKEFGCQVEGCAGSNVKWLQGLEELHSDRLLVDLTMERPPGCLPVVRVW